LYKKKDAQSVYKKNMSQAGNKIKGEIQLIDAYKDVFCSNLSTKNFRLLFTTNFLLHPKFLCANIQKATTSLIHHQIRGVANSPQLSILGKTAAG